MKDIIDRMIEYWEKTQAVELDNIRDIIKEAILNQTDDLVKQYVVAEKGHKEQEKRLKLYKLRGKEDDKVQAKIIE